MSCFLLRPSLLAVVCGFAAAPLLAQHSAASASEIIITGNPLGRDIAPASVGSLGSADLRERCLASAAPGSVRRPAAPSCAGSTVTVCAC